MSKTAMIRARTEPELKNTVERIFETLGLSCSEAINLFFRQVKLRKGLPFEVKIPNKETLRVMQDVDEKRGLGKARDAEDLFKKLKI